ncbi:monooxygenase [Diaporthe australafricana]|uniref:Monooxygenase n=1 Tax=Diaporthe australafricana TaxID=127596 RepID=A0ABR3XHJ1_9PEZI
MEAGRKQNRKSVAVIGAGVSGLVAAKRLAAEGFQVDVFERRSQPGGLWNFSADPNAPFASAVYPDLQTNFPRQLMELQDYPWTTQPLIMQHNLVQEYLQGYAREIQEKWRGRVRMYFNVEVLRLFHESYAGQLFAKSFSGGHWVLTCRSVLTGQSAIRDYLFVIITIGVFDEPSIPRYDGLSAWRDLWKGSISHAKSYRSPDAFRGKRVLIVGYQASGFDIANKIAASVSVLWISSTRPIVDALPPNAIPMAGVFCFYPSQRMIRFEDQNVISDVDHVVFCTGYQYHQPFIKAKGNTEEPLFPSGNTIEGLHEHIVYIDNPSLAFLGMVRAAVPTFLVVQAQAAFISRFFSGRLPPARQRLEDPQHTLPYPMFMDYLIRLESLCEVSDKTQTCNVSHGSNTPFRWTWELDLVRTKRREIRTAFLARPAPDTDRWSIANTIQEYRRQYLSLSMSNIRALAPFLLVYFGYKGDHESDLVLPFDGWELGLAGELLKHYGDVMITLESQLEQDSQGVLIRGFNRLWKLGLKRELSMGIRGDKFPAISRP